MKSPQNLAALGLVLLEACAATPHVGPVSVENSRTRSEALSILGIRQEGLQQGGDYVMCAEGPDSQATATRLAVQNSLATSGGGGGRVIVTPDGRVLFEGGAQAVGVALESAPFADGTCVRVNAPGAVMGLTPEQEEKVAGLDKFSLDMKREFGLDDMPDINHHTKKFLQEIAPIMTREVAVWIERAKQILIEGGSINQCYEMRAIGLNLIHDNRAQALNRIYENKSKIGGRQAFGPAKQYVAFVFESFKELVAEWFVQCKA
ncbi:hypothetical protein COV82_02450 [Candidatus Peregrinibacteria bacterium CG11_big_fil_rev_8_21_14_0_20_46_8]|nr:MAG: hypothetical protein COV82_02450 [Candidatus Peregrinibacteria bacterium CG11_big_fil_rev_8_21_14_0_20_46_8]